MLSTMDSYYIRMTTPWENTLQRGTVDTEIKAPSAVNTELLTFLSLKPGVDQNIAMHASSTARNFSLSNSNLHSPFNFIFFKILPSFFFCVRYDVIDAGSCVGL